MRRALVTAAALLAFVAILEAPRAAAAQMDEDPWLGPDKALHFSVSAGLAGGGYGVGALFFEDYAPRFLLGAGVALVAGITKELIDLAGAGDASWRDMTWNLIGTATGLLVAWLIDFAVRGLPPWERSTPEGSGDLGFVDGIGVGVDGSGGLAGSLR